MALTRVTGKVFGGEAPLDEIGQFGSALLGTKLNTQDVATIQALEAYSQGWGGAVITSRNFPPIEEVTGVLKTISYQACYSLQAGVPVYDIATDYGVGDIVKVVGGNNDTLTFYISQTTPNIGQSLSDPTYWKLATFLGAGATLTGNLNIRKSNSHLFLYNTNLTKGTAPSSNQYSGIEFCDNKASDDSWENKRLGVVEYGLLPSGASRLTISAYKNEAGSDVAASIRVEIDSSGTGSCSFPNTIRCDGQYVHAYQKLVDNLNLNNSSSSDTGWYSLSSLPNDNYSYLVWLVCNVKTGSTSGNYVYNIIKSDIETTGMTGASARTRTNSAVGNEGTICIPVNGNHRIKVARNSDWTGTGDVTMVGYRRIGQNS